VKRVRRQRFVIVGGGQCGISAAATLRTYGFDGHVVVLGDEFDHPYERPPLSKEYLYGNLALQEMLIRPADWYRENDVDLRLGARVEAVSPEGHSIRLADGTDLGYDRLLIATGGRPRRLPGLAGDRIVYLRSRSDADFLGKRLVPGDRLVVLGAGFIGCEVAATARRRGVEVTLIEMLDAPLQRVLGAELGQVFTGIHRDEGVEVRTGERVEEVCESATGLTVETGSGRIQCSMLLVAIGTQPNVEMLAGSGIELADGVLVDEYCATSAADVFAAGDVARHYHPLFRQRLRVEHYDTAIKQGGVAARNMLGDATAFNEIHWFWSDQYGYNLQSVGVARAWDEVVYRGSIGDRSFSAFYLQDGRVRRIVALNRPKDVFHGRKLVRSEIPVSVADLADDSVDLRGLVRSSSAQPGRCGGPTGYSARPN
jgi:3-phenylpropionate/trans-cinnamate dioxygenase ferredoxin reductase subunit